MKLNILFLTLDDISVLKFFAYSVQESLGDTSIDILEAHSDEEAIKILKTTKINLVITDMNISTLEPYEFHDYLQLNPSYKDIPFIFLSSDEEDRIIVISKRNSDFFLKPLNIDQLTDTLNTILKKEKSTQIDRNNKLFEKPQLESIYQDTNTIETLVQNCNCKDKEIIVKLTTKIKEQLNLLRL